MNAPNDKEAILARFKNGGSEYMSYVLCDSDNFDDYNKVLNGTYVYNCNGTFNIDDNIIYESGSFSRLTEIPKVIIIAKSIKINCSVSEINAVLIATEGDVDTCSGAGKVNAWNRSRNQLKINGAVIVEKMNAGRTFGAEAGTALKFIEVGILVVRKFRQK